MIILTSSYQLDSSGKKHLFIKGLCTPTFIEKNDVSSRISLVIIRFQMRETVACVFTWSRVATVSLVCLRFFFLIYLAVFKKHSKTRTLLTICTEK